MKIQVLNVTQVQATAKNGKPYSKLDVAYKNLADGKVAGKTLMPFGDQRSAFEVLSTANSGDIFEVTPTKNIQGYWDWTAVNRTTADAPTATAASPTRAGGNPAPRSNYETPEERAARQIYIVRQSSVSSAIAMLTPGSKSALDVDHVLDVARRLEAYVFDKQLDVSSEGAAALVEMSDDIPY